MKEVPFGPNECSIGFIRGFDAKATTSPHDFRLSPPFDTIYQMIVDTSDLLSYFTSQALLNFALCGVYSTRRRQQVVLLVLIR
jgi:hypothetical protein